MRMTVPKEVAERMGLKEGDKLVVYYDPENDRLVVEKWGKGKRCEPPSRGNYASTPWRTKPSCSTQ
ncbi:MAG TPA: AbrB/MazE/SpoVT family DNA-binding domain-containing protein [Methanomicrobia archaeon]|nr:AbrB/MazE/SpoVT family DNA-binding domain-containing protein [Methanomicrobia archaeon]HEX58974.1 AbrB/MazE/SpoVT family DNA-binding domain-containing protein [Methanomicrobia archaeon]